MIEWCVLRDKKINAIEQIFQPQQGADTFIQGIFVGNHALDGRGWGLGEL